MQLTPTRRSPRTTPAPFRADAKELKKKEFGKIPVPPKYISSDSESDCWRLRGKLDVPKERWVSFPHCEGPDGTLSSPGPATTTSSSPGRSALLR